MKDIFGKLSRLTLTLAFAGIALTATSLIGCEASVDEDGANAEIGDTEQID